MNQAPDNLKAKNEETYEELISLIENTQGRLAPIVIACDDLALQKRIIERYETEARQSKIRPYRIVLGQEPSVRAGLAALKEKEAYLQSGGEAVFTVTGAEFLLRVKLNPQDEQSDLDKFFGYLQWTREGLREFRYPIAIWVSYRILKEMSRRAPDFWSWRKAVLRFVTESEPAPIAALAPDPPMRQLEDDADDEFLPPIAELQAEIAQSEARDPQSAGLATLYQKLGQVYARRVNRGEAENLEAEREKAIAAFREAIDRYQAQNSLSAPSVMLRQLGNFLDSQSLYTEAIVCCEQALEISRELGDRREEAASLDNLGIMYRELGQYHQAIGFHQQSLNINREIGDRWGETASLSNLGSVYNALGQYAQAVEFHQQSLDINREIGDRDGEGGNLCNIGTSYYSLKQYARAIEFYQQALGVQREVGNRDFEANSLWGLGNVYLLLEQYARALEFYQQALKIKHKIGDRDGEAVLLSNMAFALAKLDRRWEALQNYKQAQQIYEDLNLDHKVEECKTAIYELQQIVSHQPIRAPKISDESAVAPKSRKRQRFPWWGWVLVGVAIALLIAWCLR